MEAYCGRDGQNMVLFTPPHEAGIAQLVEQLICNQQVIGSNPIAGSSFKINDLRSRALVHRLANNGNVVAFKMGRRQGARRAHI